MGILRDNVARAASDRYAARCVSHAFTDAIETRAVSS